MTATKRGFTRDIIRIEKGCLDLRTRRELDNNAAQLIESIPEDERAVRRLERLGPTALSNAELLELVIGGKAQVMLPLRLLSTYSSLIEIANAYPLDLLRIAGMTRNRSARIRAALELGKRTVSLPRPERAVIGCPQDVANLLSPDMSGLSQEQMRVVHLNRKNGVLGVATVYQGSVHTLIVRSADIFRDAVRSNSTGIVVAHNHPTGEPTPSAEDVQVTRALVSAGKALDIEMMDHIVIGTGNRWVSLKERGLGFG